jgi:hypothetical protein
VSFADLRSSVVTVKNLVQIVSATQKTCVYSSQADTKRVRNTPHTSTQQSVAALPSGAYGIEAKAIVCHDSSANVPELVARIKILEESVLHHSKKSTSAAHRMTTSLNTLTSANPAVRILIFN